jgi:hypothetical protein
MVKMVNQKRFTISLIFGFIAGLICFIGAILLDLPADFIHFLNIIANRTLLGFVIGISALKMKWYLHGLILGEIVGLPFFFFDLISGVSLLIVIGVLFINALFGLMIEFFTSIVFKASNEIA